MEIDYKRKKSLKWNTVSSLMNQVVTLICGFILPKVILKTFGSEVNGLVTSINQFLSVITFLDLGVGAVVTSAFYEPLAKKQDQIVAQIYLSAKRFFGNIAKIFLLYIAILFFVYPNYIESTFGFWYTSSLILVISITLFSQYFFGIVNQLLLNADQKTYVVMITQCITVLCNTVACVILMKFGASIQIVKLTTSIIFLARPLVLTAYVKKHYRIDEDTKIEGEPIKQKWNGLAQHLAFIIMNNTDSIVLTIFSNLQNVSIYGVYNLVVNGVKTMFKAMTAGMTALFGNMLAKREYTLLENVFDDFEWLIHTSMTLIFTICGIMIVPFVSVYTSGVNDANYIQPVFASIITLANGVYCLRFPYDMMVHAAGHYKETQNSSFVEMTINIVINVLAVKRFGLVGIAVGTFCAMLYRTCYLAWYLSKNIMYRNIKHFIKHCLVDVVSVIIMVSVTTIIPKSCSNYFEWVVTATVVSSVCLIIVIAINYIIYRNNLKNEVNKIFRKFTTKRVINER